MNPQARPERSRLRGRQRRVLLASKIRIKDLLQQVRGHQRQIARMAIQTAVASAGTYLLVRWMDLPYASWGVIAALFTIGLSADASYYNAVGRISGALLGSVIGLAAAWAAGPLLIGLVIGTALANAIAAVWPSLRYAAVTAAIVALDPTPDAGTAMQRVVVILIGTAVGAGSSFLVWPVFGRQRAAYALRSALDDCQVILDLIVRGLDEDDMRDREKAHARFLGHLETARSRLSETRFRPELPNGASLRRAFTAVEYLWHSIVILDRAVSEGQEDVDADVIQRLKPAVCELQEAACGSLSRVRAGMAARNAPDLRPDRFRGAVERARDEIKKAARESPSDLTIRHKRLNALVFAVDQMEFSLLELYEVLLEEAERNG